MSLVFLPKSMNKIKIITFYDHIVKWPKRNVNSLLISYLCIQTYFKKFVPYVIRGAHNNLLIVDSVYNYLRASAA